MSTEERQDSHKGGEFVKHMLVYGLGVLTFQIASLVLLPLYTRYLEPSEYGLVQLIYRVGEVLNICLMANGIQLATLNLYGHASDGPERRAIAPTLVALVAAVLAAGSVIVLLFARPLSALLGVSSPGMFSLGVIAILLQATTMVPLSLMQARMDSRSYVISTVSISLCHVGGALVAIGLFGWGVWGVLAALALAYGGMGIVLTLRELSRSRSRVDPALMRTAARFAAPFIPAGLLFFILRSGDQFFLTRFSGLEVLGFYALGYRLASVAMLVMYPFRQVWNAWMYEAYKQPDSAVVFGRVITRGLAVYMFGGVVLLAFVDEVFAILARPEYARATKVIAPIVLANLFLAASHLMDASFYVKRKTTLKPVIAAGSTTVMLVLYATLIPRYHDIGAAYATLLGLLVHAAFTAIVAQRVFRINFEHGRIVGALMLSLLVYAGTQMMGTGVFEFVLKTLLCMSWPVVAWIVGLITEDEKRAVLAGVLWLKGRASRVSDRS